MKKKSFELTLWGIFAAVGVLCIAMGLGLFLSRSLDPNHIETVGTVVRRAGRTTEISYAVDGEAYRGVLNGTSSAYVPGKEIAIYYDEDDPSAIGAPGLDLLFLIPALPGLAFAAVGGIGLGCALSKKRRGARLKESGRKVWAKFEAVRVNYSYTYNGRHPCNVFCVWRNPEDGMEYRFKSELLWSDPTPRIQERGMEQFPVFLDEKNVKRYYVDISSLTENLVDLT